MLPDVHHRPCSRSAQERCSTWQPPSQLRQEGGSFTASWNPSPRPEFVCFGDNDRLRPCPLPLGMPFCGLFNWSLCMPGRGQLRESRSSSRRDGSRRELSIKEVCQVPFIHNPGTGSTAGIRQVRGRIRRTGEHLKSPYPTWPGGKGI